MNYQHAFHAGNFADVHKHIVLLALLSHLRKKSKPFFVLDTHAGRGLYDLRTSAAQRSNEWSAGIGRLRQNFTAEANDIPELTHYLQRVRQVQSPNTSAAQFYPGSPLLITTELRENDRAVFVEKQSEEATALKTFLKTASDCAPITVLSQDGYAALKAHLPPKENRGLVLIDPPFEASDEFAQLADALQFAVKRWGNGIFCAWYPLKPGGAYQRFHRQLQAAGVKKLLLLELSVQPSDSPLGLIGSGLLIVNPPYQLDDRMRMVLPKLHAALAHAGGVRVEWLAGE